jgi:hypothetical protein
LQDRVGRLGVIQGPQTIVVIAPRPPPLPDLFGAFGQQVLGLETILQGKLSRTGTDQVDVIGGVHDQLGDLRRMHDVLDRTDRSSIVGGAVHTSRIQADVAAFIGEAAVADRHIVGVGFDDSYPANRSTDRAKFLRRDQLVGNAACFDSVSGCDCHRIVRAQEAATLGGTGCRKDPSGKTGSGPLEQSTTRETV